jgi:hypothetical protein
MFKCLKLLHNSGLFVKLFQVAYHHERSISWFSPVHGRHILGRHNDNLRSSSMVFYLHSKIAQKTLCKIWVIMVKNFVKYVNNEPILVAARSMAWVYDWSFPGVVGSNPTAAWMSLCCECCVFSGTGTCDELITCSEESYRAWCVWCDREASIMRRPWLLLRRKKCQQLIRPPHPVKPKIYETCFSRY